MEKVERWGRFETDCYNGHHYEDPFRDVTLEAIYTRPDGTEVSFWGFYDGKVRWRLRFMPDQLGTWRYQSRFTDGSPGPSGRFECVVGDTPGTICAYEHNPIWFGHRDGPSFFMRSLHVGDRFFASNWDSQKRSAFLDWAQEQGYNTLSIASHYLNREVEGRGLEWQTPDLWPLNPSEFRRLEETMDDLERRRFVIYPFGGFFGQDSDFPRARRDQELYVRYVLARFAPYWNVLFNVAGPEPLVHAQRFGYIMMYDDVCRLGAMIGELDPFGHLVTIHNRTADDPFRDEEWLGFGTMQGPKTTDLTELGVRHEHVRGVDQLRRPRRSQWGGEGPLFGRLQRNLGAIGSIPGSARHCPPRLGLRGGDPVPTSASPPGPGRRRMVPRRGGHVLPDLSRGGR